MPEIERVLIRDLSHDGRGIAKLNDYTLFIPLALPGEEVDISITKRKPSYGEANLHAIIQKQKERVAPPCPVFPLCGGCQLQHLEYEAQIAFKKKKISMALERIAKLENPPSITAHKTQPWRYRNKGDYHSHQGQLGFYGSKSNQVIPHQRCLIQHKGSEVYKEELEKKGLVSSGGCILRTSSLTKEGIVILKKEPSLKDLKGLSLSGIFVQKRTNIKHLSGEKTLSERMGPVTFELPPSTFFQVHDEGREILLERAWALLNPREEDILLDLYCGVGALSLPYGEKVDRLMGVDGDREAIQVAKEHAKKWRLDHASFSCHNLEKGALGFLKDSPNLALLDPPRGGCSQALLLELLKSSVERLVYISCDPATLSRDLKIVKSGFFVKELEMVDMFPQTYHVECVVVLER